MIEGVKITALRQIEDDRGKVMHMMRSDNENFNQFGEIYFSTVNPGFVKGWHLHLEMEINYAVPIGSIKLVLYDDRQTSKSKGTVEEILLSPDKYCCVKIPPLIWNGFKGMGDTPALIANCSSIPHNPEEILRISYLDPKVPYVW
ncbi:dTDP-4-dehydrorhamnose 3,5-epimerase family protein [Candidatus Puniceispirillum sp.]|nr:dTDP-4-dehydrorhamnose 3,5-epimerase family protein [Candidatus Puniceispirillum sp.]